MKTEKLLFKSMKLLGGALLMILFFVSAFAGVPGITMLNAGAAATIPGTATNEAVAAAAANLLRPDISNLITKVRRDTYPLDTIMREIGKVRKIESTEHKFYTKDERGIKDVTTAAYVFNSAKSGNVAVTNPHFWQPHDIAIIPGVNGGDGKKLRVMVSAVDMTANTITVTAINGRTVGSAVIAGDLLPEIGNTSSMSRIGNAHGETDAQADAIEIAPYDTFNWTQIFMAQVEESLVQKAQLKEVDMGILDYKEDAIADLRAQAELAMLFGYPKKGFYDPVLRKTVNLMGGADFFITKEKQYTKATAIDNKIFNAWAKYIFAGNNGSDKRILFAGNTLLENMMNADIVTKQLIGGTSTEFVAGVRFTKIETAFGIFLVRRHQLFEEIYGYTDHGLVLDLENIEKGIYEPTQTKSLNLDETGQKRVDAIRILEHWSMAFKNLDTHCWIKGV